MGAIKVQKWAITEGRETGVTTWSLVSGVKISTVMGRGILEAAELEWELRCKSELSLQGRRVE